METCGKSCQLSTLVSTSRKKIEKNRKEIEMRRRAKKPPGGLEFRHLLRYCCRLRSVAAAGRSRPRFRSGAQSRAASTPPAKGLCPAALPPVGGASRRAMGLCPAAFTHGGRGCRRCPPLGLACFAAAHYAAPPTAKRVGAWLCGWLPSPRK